MGAGAALDLGLTPAVWRTAGEHSSEMFLVREGTVEIILEEEILVGGKAGDVSETPVRPALPIGRGCLCTPPLCCVVDTAGIPLQGSRSIFNSQHSMMSSLDDEDEDEVCRAVGPFSWSPGGRVAGGLGRSSLAGIMPTRQGSDASMPRSLFGGTVVWSRAATCRMTGTRRRRTRKRMRRTERSGTLWSTVWRRSSR